MFVGFEERFLQLSCEFELNDVAWFRIGYEDGRKLNPFNPPKWMKVAARSYLDGFLTAQAELTLVY